MLIRIFNLDWRSLKGMSMSLTLCAWLSCIAMVFGGFNLHAEELWPHEMSQWEQPDITPNRGKKGTSPTPPNQFRSAPTAGSASARVASRGTQNDVVDPTSRGVHGQDFIEVSADGRALIRPLKPVTPTMVRGEDGQYTASRDTKEASPAYRLFIGDRLMVSIYGEGNTQREVIVDGAGQITYPIVGTMFVVGKTIDEVRREMNERIRKIYRYTFVTITPVQFGGQSYTVLGAVSQPGRKLLLGSETVLSALCRAGGFPTGTYRTQTVDLSDLDHAFLTRKGEYLPVDFQKLVVEGDLSQDVPLEPGDYIYVPTTLEKEIFVLGEVFIPSALGYITRLSLIDSIAMAGGLTQNASSRALVVRGSLKEPYTFYIDINLILKGCERDFALRPGDIVYVPPRQYTILRDLAQYAVRVFVGTFASDAGSNAWAEITGSTPSDNANVIPTGGPSGFAAPAPSP
jgi:protein involved in polysaccharide export with SLBB domain